MTDLAGATQIVTALAILGAPAISADGSSVAFATAAPFSAADRNKAPDIYVADVSTLFGHTRRAAPVPAFTNVVEGQRINSNQNFSVTGSASDLVGTIKETAMELNGVLIGRGTGASLSRLINVPPGSHTLTFRAYNDAYVAAETAIGIVALPPNGSRGLAGAANVTTTENADGSLAWSGAVRIENRTATARNFRVALTIAPTPAIMGPNQTPDDGPGFSDVRVLPQRDERIAFVSGVINVGANGSALLDAQALLPAPEVIGNGLQGIAWSLIGILLEETLSGTVSVNRQTLFTHVPVLSEKTNGPNGGATNPGVPLADGALVLPSITSLTLQVPPRIPERSTRALTALANFSDDSTKPCSPVWEVIAGGNGASVNAYGVITTRDITTPVNVRLRATLPGPIVTEATTLVVPVIPAVSVIAVDKLAVESGDPARFRVARSASLQDPLTINLEVGGTAVEGVDYVPLARTVSMAPGVTRAFVEIVPIDDSEFGGLKTVTLSIAGDPAYRVAGLPRTIQILDDEAPLPRQVDLVLRAGGVRVGKDVYETPSALSELSQTLTRATSAGTTATFFLEAKNRGTESGEYLLRGAPDFSGFVLRYFDRTTEVTGDVASGGSSGYTFTLAPGAQKIITVRVTTTSAAAPRFLQRLPFDVRETSGNPSLSLPDAAELIVFRR